MRPIFCGRRKSGAFLRNERCVRTGYYNKKRKFCIIAAQLRFVEHDQVIECFPRDRKLMRRSIAAVLPP